MVTALSLLTACGGNPKTTAEAEKFDYTVEQFADLQILRYRVPGFEDLSLKQKELVYYLTEAALQGRDILFDQNGKYNLTIRRMLEAVYTGYKGDKNTPDFKAMEVYLKRVWFSNGIHHHYGSEKFGSKSRNELFAAIVMMNTIGEPYPFQIHLHIFKIRCCFISLIVCIYCFEHPTDSQIIFSILVKQNIPSLQSSLCQVINQFLLFQRQFLKSGNFITQYL